MMTNIEAKDSAVQQLLDSPLARELERSKDAEAARSRAAADLKALKSKNAASLALLQAAARDAIARRDQLRREYEAASAAAIEAGGKASRAMESYASSEAELRKTLSDSTKG